MPRKRTSGKRRDRSKANGLGTVYQRKNGSWAWQVTLGYTPEKKRITKSGTAPDKTSAEIALQHATSDHLRGKIALPDSTTFAEYANRWVARQKSASESTRRSYGYDLTYASKHLGELRVQDIQRHHIADTLSLLADLEVKRGLGAGKTLSSRTLAHVLTRLRAVFREAILDRLITADQNPMQGIRRVKVARTEHPGIALDFDQVARLRELGETLYDLGLSRLWPALFIAVSCGLRRGEVMGLAWKHVDLEKSVLYVRQNLIAPGGKVELKHSPKSDAGNRSVPIPASLKVMLERHKYAISSAGFAVRGDAPVFPTENGVWTHPDNLDRAMRELVRWSDPNAPAHERKRPSVVGEATPKPRVFKVVRSSLERRLKAIPRDHRAQLEAVVLAGKPLPEISPHDLRHTAGTLWIRRGMPIAVVSKRLGHSDPAFTYRVYQHVLESEIDAPAPDLFDQPMPERSIRRATVN